MNISGVLSSKGSISEKVTLVDLDEVVQVFGLYKYRFKVARTFIGLIAANAVEFVDTKSTNSTGDAGNGQINVPESSDGSWEPQQWSQNLPIAQGAIISDIDRVQSRFLSTSVNFSCHLSLSHPFSSVCSAQFSFSPEYLLRHSGPFLLKSSFLPSR